MRPVVSSKLTHTALACWFDCEGSNIEAIGGLVPAVSLQHVSPRFSCHLNFGATPFAHPPPAGGFQPVQAWITSHRQLVEPGAVPELEAAHSVATAAVSTGLHAVAVTGRAHAIVVAASNASVWSELVHSMTTLRAEALDSQQSGGGDAPIEAAAATATAAASPPAVEVPLRGMLLGSSVGPVSVQLRGGKTLGFTVRVVVSGKATIGWMHRTKFVGSWTAGQGVGDDAAGASLGLTSGLAAQEEDADDGAPVTDAPIGARCSNGPSHVRCHNALVAALPDGHAVLAAGDTVRCELDCATGAASFTVVSGGGAASGALQTTSASATVPAKFAVGDWVAGITVGSNCLLQVDDE